MFKQFNLKKLAPVLVWISIAVMGMAFFLFEYVNYITTAESLTAMFGDDLWITCTALAMVVIDIAALILVFVPEGAGKATSTVMKTLLIIWGLVSGLDMLLSWYFAALRMENTAVRAPGAITDVLWIMPIAIAFMLWGVQVGMLYTLGQLIGGGSRHPAMSLSRVPERG